ncbi:MAG TPA: DUF2844 domain-containing protein [Casimicrobiaceae bacterium]
MNPYVRRPLWRIALLVGWAIVAGIAALPARAALGGGEATVEADRLQVGGTLRVLRLAAYTVHELQVPSGTVVREYVSPAGTVFGVAWQGPSMPDLRQVLGTYFDRYVDAVTKRKARGPVLIEQPGLVVQSSGHMRAFVGRAYIPEAFPQGVVADAVR